MTRYTNLSTSQKTRNKQSDVISPIIVGSGNLGVTTGPIAYQLIMNENSYAIAHTGSAVASSGQGMPVTITGAIICSELTSSAVTTNTGVATITLTPSTYTLYSGCTLFIRDHAGNPSNTIALPQFVYGTGVEAFCSHPALNISTSECL